MNGYAILFCQNILNRSLAHRSWGKYTHGEMIGIPKRVKANTFVVIWLCLIVLLDLGMHIRSIGLFAWSSLVSYPVSCALSFVLWESVFSRLFSRKREPLYWLLMTLACGLFVGCALLPAAYRHLTSSVMPISVWTFLLRNPAYAASLIRDQLNGTRISGALILLAVV